MQTSRGVKATPLAVGAGTQPGTGVRDGGAADGELYTVVTALTGLDLQVVASDTGVNGLPVVVVGLAVVVGGLAVVLGATVVVGMRLVVVGRAIMGTGRVLMLWNETGETRKSMNRAESSSSGVSSGKLCRSFSPHVPVAHPSVTARTRSRRPLCADVGTTNASTRQSTESSRAVMMARAMACSY